MAMGRPAGAEPVYEDSRARGDALDADTPVLKHCAVLPDIDPAALSRFDDNCWRLDEGIFEENVPAARIDFTSTPESLTRFAKHYLWVLINCEAPTPLLRSRVTRPSLRTVISAWPLLRFFLTWLDQHGICQVGDVTVATLDEYLTDVLDSGVSVEVQYRRIAEVRRLWSYRSLLPERMQLPQMPPWGVDPPHDVLGKTRQQRENRTPRIAETTMQALLSWSLRFVEDFSPDIVTAFDEYRWLRTRSREGQLHFRGTTEIVSPDEAYHRCVDYLEKMHREKRCLPGKYDPDGTLRIDWAHVGKIIGFPRPWNLAQMRAGQLLTHAGLPLSEAAFLEAPITAEINGSPWHTGPITSSEVRMLARHLSTACLVVIAYLSGARAGEVLHLRRGCIEHDAASGMWLMSGTYFKNAVGPDGNKLPGGSARRDPWVVVKPVADAVATLEKLHDSELLFPTKLLPRFKGNAPLRKGTARVGQSVIEDLRTFTDWVNALSTYRGLTGIAEDKHGALNVARLRRTLAWFIRRRPRGLVAGSIQYGHVHTRLMQGYAGDYQSGFPDEVAFEDFLARLDQFAEDQRELKAGEHVSGPATQHYRDRIATANHLFAGHVLSSRRQARDLLANPALQIYHGDAMTCVFDARVAACQLRGQQDDPSVTPDLDDCRPSCVNIARTDRDVAVLAERHQTLTTILDDRLAPPIRLERHRNELMRITKLMEAHRDTHT
jgi:integrase